jgi:hypothetical protein
VAGWTTAAVAAPADDLPLFRAEIGQKRQQQSGLSRSAYPPYHLPMVKLWPSGRKQLLPSHVQFVNGISQVGQGCRRQATDLSQREACRSGIGQEIAHDSLQKLFGYLEKCLEPLPSVHSKFETPLAGSVYARASFLGIL